MYRCFNCYLRLCAFDIFQLMLRFRFRFQLKKNCIWSVVSQCTMISANRSTYHNGIFDKCKNSISINWLDKKNIGKNHRPHKNSTIIIDNTLTNKTINNWFLISIERCCLLLRYIEYSLRIVIPAFVAWYIYKMMNVVCLSIATY